MTSKTTSPIRAAFIGCGGIAAQYLDVYRDLDFVALVACIDTNLERAQQAAAQVADDRNEAPRATNDFKDALRDDVDVVVINTPNHLHRAQAEAALAAGKHVLLQKPVAARLHDAEAILQAADRARHQRGIVAGLYLSYFDQPLMHDLKAMIEAGWFGEVAHLYARLMHRGGLVLSKQLLRGEENWRGSLEQTGGGCFIQLAVHYIHLFKWMLDARVVRVTAMTRNQFSPGIEGEDIACALLEFSNGALATLDMAWNTAGEQLSIHGTRGTCEYLGNRTLLLDSDAGVFQGQVVDYAGQGGQASPLAPGEAATQQASEVIAPRLGDADNPFNQHRMFLEAVRDKDMERRPFVSIASGVDDLRVVEAVYQSSKLGRAVEL